MTLEYWKYDAGTDAVAPLVIPAALGRARTFDLDATLQVHVQAKVQAQASEPWFELSVEVDGQRWWARRVPAQSPGDTDGLDYHCRLTVEADAECRVRAKANGQGVRVLSLVLEARETAY